MSNYLDRAAELIEDALKTDLTATYTTAASAAKAKRDASDRLAKLAEIEYGHDIETLRTMINELKD